ncbi:MAG: methyltransferase [Bacteroidetes bacterium]|nr:methyltransferase [Bacteroidota bacterium]MBU1114554.1 methyltransferase [Bacteroidota bacterium]MBU1800471.1 methyltransferase [Bacteroidota bacterium]
MNYQYGNREFSITRYPSSTNKSLTAWNAADEYILKYIDENKTNTKDILIYNDRFGFLSLFLSESKPKAIIESKSQEKAINQNLISNNVELKNFEFLTPFQDLKLSVETIIIKVPKSAELFRFYLEHLSEVLTANSVVICGFMTKYFTPQILEIANKYFELAEQTLALKKSRLLILKNPKKTTKASIINEIKLNDKISLKQYSSVFSSKNIDYATQFLIDNINLKETDKKVLDLGSGNGVLACVIKGKNENCEIHLLDDSLLAIESSKLNISGENIHFHYNDNLKEFDDNYFDFIVSNPPFHFEHETNIEIAISLFEEAVRCLKRDGHLQLVANKHLNYKTHLIKIFENVEITAENEKFVIYDCFF